MTALRLAPLAAALLALGAQAATPTPQPEPRPPRAEFPFDARAFDAQVRDLVRDVEKATHHRVFAQLGHDFVFDGDAGALAFVAGEMGGTREIVKNAPYTAEAVSESVQVLADGNRIVRESRTLLARDAQGRTRQEKKGPRGTTVYVFDPIENASFALHPERKTVLRLPRVPVPPVPPMGPLPPVPPVPPGAASVPVPPAPGATARVQTRNGEVIVERRSEGGDGRDVRVEVIRVARPDGLTAPAPSLLALPALPKGKGETKSLGTREFDGVKAEGTLTTHTIAAGEIGNERPIVVTSERWFAPDLHVVVFARTADPRAGETTYRLANLRREDPPADLFRIPADYKGAQRR